MAKLSKREKILIYIAFLMSILCFGFYLLLLPKKLIYLEAKASYSNAVARQDNKNILFQAEDTLSAAFEREKEYYSSHQEEFGGRIDSVWLEEKVLEYLNQYEIQPESTKIIENQTVEGSKLLLKTSITVSASGTLDQIFVMFNQLERQEEIYIAAYQLDYLSDRNIYQVEFTADYYMAADPDIFLEDIS